MESVELKKIVKKIREDSTIRFFFCYSDDAASDVDKLRLSLYDKKDSFFPCLDVRLGCWKNMGVFKAHHPNKQIQDFFDTAILQSQFVVFIVKNRPGKNTLHEWDLCMRNDSKTREIVLGIKTINDEQVEEIHNCFNGKKNNVFEYRYSDVSEVENAILNRLVIINRMIEKRISKFTDDKNVWNLLSTSDFNHIIRVCQNSGLKKTVDINKLLLSRIQYDPSYSVPRTIAYSRNLIAKENVNRKDVRTFSRKHSSAKIVTKALGTNNSSRGLE